MADQYIQVQPNSTGLKVDTTELTVNGQTVERQRINIADSVNAEYLANVTSAGALQVDGSAVTQIFKLTDGTNTANVTAGDTGENALMIARTRHEVAFSTTTAQGVAATDCTNYAWVSVQIQGQGTSSTVNFQCSNDNLNWYTLELSNSNTANGIPVSSATTTGIFHGPLFSRYFRLNVTGISAGTTQGTIEFLTMPVAPLVIGAQVAQSGTWSVQASQSGTWTVQPGNTANTTPWLTSNIPATSGGLTGTHLVSAATTNATSVKTSAGQVFNIQGFNVNTSSPRYLKIYNKASAPTVGTDTPIAVYLIPPNYSGVVCEISNGLACSTGIAFAITGGIADTDATAIAASEVVINLQYK